MRLTSTSSMLLASVAISSAAAMPLSPIVVPTQDVAALLGLTSASSTPSFASSASVPTRGPALHRKKRDDAGFTLDDPDTSSVLGAQMGLPAFIEGTELEPAAAIPINSWMRAHSTTFTTQSTAAAVSTASSTNPLFHGFLLLKLR
ncbi:hypothetical protein PUNSTDRAFT_134173 [Punctularia strigosozonata HHB-11173 SS5]|uniref:uncharacterized protein n=1 Tax=Punctularia strigosozonata (strain HHB-11173) TaxID=741275 RepID=UPI000441820E|nr:uncharacterized protein PUNSTDRAFT_134173 [Punctularia strigosozonata HHB-11173 SS5]EIN08999.1 hypothetical protein PUNSTDRAFT_134173 [Punctularia strigosozonata HHB-11173 SS5]